MTNLTTDHHEMTTAAGQLMNDYFFGLDAGDFERAAACFTEGVECSYGGIDLPPGRDAVVDYLHGALDGVRSTRHFSTSSGPVQSGAGVRVRTHAIAYVVVGEGGTGEAQVRGITYDDELVKTEKGWLVARRSHNVDWTSSASAVFVAPGEDSLVRSGASAGGTR
jgi:hypothetical protein